MSTLTSKARAALPKKDFVFPATKSYPISNIVHARNALSRVAANGSASEIAKVKAAVRKKFPNINVG